jgi:hypothetical protein
MGAPLFRIRFLLGIGYEQSDQVCQFSQPDRPCALLAQMSAPCGVAQHEREMIAEWP